MDTKESFYFLHSTVLSSLSLLWSSHSLMYFSQHALTSRVLGGDLREKRWQHFPERLQSRNFLGETPEKYLQLTLTFGCFFKFCFTTLNIYFYVYGFCLRTWTFGNSIPSVLRVIKKFNLCNAMRMFVLYIYNIKSWKTTLISIESFLLTFAVFGFDYCATGFLFVLLYYFNLWWRRGTEGRNLNRKVGPDYRGEERLQF